MLAYWSQRWHGRAICWRIERRSPRWRGSPRRTHSASSRTIPFVDGNKRTALVIAFAFLDMNGIEMNASEEDAYRMFMDLASGRVSEEELGAWISDNSE